MNDNTANGLISEREASVRLGVSRTTLLRARGAGRIRFFRIGTRVLYSETQLDEFLAPCERNGKGQPIEFVENQSSQQILILMGEALGFANQTTSLENES